jgi:tetratricopeptide (TPR) repeat protein
LNRLRTVTVGILTATILASAQAPDKASAGAAASGVHAQKPQTETQLDGDQTLFTVMAAINASGYDVGANSTLAHPLRAYIRQQLAAKNLASVRALKEFYYNNQHGDPAENLAQYVSFALSIAGPPEFQFLNKASQTAPDALRLSDLPPVLSLFYEEAGIEDLWRQAQPALEQVIAFYHTPLSRSILGANAYLRSETSGVLGHRFQVYVDLLGPPGQIQSRNYRTDTFVVMTPAIAATRERTEELAAEQVADVRHAYLHSLLDPLAVRYYQQIDEKQDLQELAKPAPALEPMYKDDFMMLVTESLIKAIEARLSPDPVAKREAMVNDALHEGFILTPAFYDGLAYYEKQDRAMQLYYPDLIRSISMKAERQRLAGIQFAAARARRGPDTAQAGRRLLTNAQKLLGEGEELSDLRQFDLARTAFQKVLEEPPEPNVRARAYYGLARIAVLQKDPEMAEKTFLKAIDAGPDGETRSWAYYYLGRLEDAADQREEALKYFRLAVDTPDGSRKAKDEAQKAMDGKSTPNNGSR